MKLLIFDLHAPLAHFRRPDSTATHPTYPFISGTGLRGLLGAILGLSEFEGHALTGIQIINPVQTRFQELSMLGKGFLGSGPAFNRPTSIEMVIQPHYRIYYIGDYFEELAENIRGRKSTFLTYLGSAFALCTPQFIDIIEVEKLESEPESFLTSLTVIPTDMVSKLESTPGYQFARANGFSARYLGDRRFRGTIDFIYERQGKPIKFLPIIDEHSLECIAVLASGEAVVLW